MSNNTKNKFTKLDDINYLPAEIEVMFKGRKQFIILSSILWFAVMLTLFMFMYLSTSEIRYLKMEIQNLKKSIAVLEDLINNDDYNLSTDQLLNIDIKNLAVFNKDPDFFAKISSDEEESIEASELVPKIRQPRFVFDDFENVSMFRTRFNQNRNSPEDEYNSQETPYRHRSENSDDRRIKYGRMRPLPTAHFSGTTAKYILGQHRNFNGNGHLRHLQRTYVDWEAKNWMRSLGMERHYSLNDGTVTINDSGLYFIYAQIYHLDEHDVNGFRVYKNSNPILQCTTTGHSSETSMKGNTCFTAGAEYLQQGDEISVGDLFDSRYSLFEAGKSFFGLIKLGDIKLK